MTPIPPQITKDATSITSLLISLHTITEYGMLQYHKSHHQHVKLFSNDS